MKESFAGRKMTTGTEQTQKGLWVRLGLMVLVLFFGLCTVFAAVVTAAQAWQEHVQARWPEVTARVDDCGLTRTSTREREMFYIRCRLNYTVGAEQHAATIYSIRVPSRELWQYPPNQIAPFEDWVSNHPQGTPIVVRYDPDDHAKVAQWTTDMPRGGPHTPNNVKLLEVCAGGFLLLLTIARITRPRSPSQNGYSGMPLNP
jgi:uncharacterized protein DUF3592